MSGHAMLDEGGKMLGMSDHGGMVGQVWMVEHVLQEWMSADINVWLKLIYFTIDFGWSWKIQVNMGSYQG